MAVGDEAKVGANSWTVYQLETTYGTDAVTSTSFKMLQPLSVGFKVTIDSMKLEELSVNRGFARRVQTNRQANGTLEMYAHPDEQIGLWANALGGTFTFASLTSGALFSITSGNWSTGATALSLSFQVRKGDAHSFKYLGGVVNTLRLSGKVGEPLKLTAELVFQDGSDTTAELVTMTAAMSYSSSPPFIFNQAYFAYSNSDTSANTTTAREPIQEFELEINNNLVTDDAARQLGTRVLSRRPPGQKRDVKLRITQRFDTTTAMARFLQATVGSVQILAEGATISAEQSLAALYIRLPLVYQNSSDPEVGGPGVIQAQIEYDCVLDLSPATTTARDIGVTLRSARTTNI